MRKNYLKCLGVLCSFALSSGLYAQEAYRDHQTLGQRLQELATQHATASLETIADTPGGNPIYCLTIGGTNHQDNPAVAVVGGIDGKHILGPELALRFAEKLLQSSEDSVQQLLSGTTFYVFPNMSPDGTAQYFDALQYERSANAKPADMDRDGRVNEDPYEDLNQDGRITMIRVEDATGDYLPHPDDARILVKASAIPGASGRYKVYSEGIDNDKDGKFNEDGEGGIYFNKSLTYKHPHFESGAGEHAVSEPENRALLDFLFEAWNVYAVMSFGPDNNLAEPWQYNEEKTKIRVISSVLKDDLKIFEDVAKSYQDLVNTDEAPKAQPKGGDFAQWAYFHYGRLSFTTPGWWFPKAVSDTVEMDGPESRELKFLKWAEEEDITDYFVDWETVDHPDFPNNQVEVGGITPFVMHTPPVTYLDSLADVHSAFIYQLANMKPQIAIENTKVVALGNNVYRIDVDIHNPGQLPALTELGERNVWLKKVKVEVMLNDNQELLSGNRIYLYDNLKAGETKKLSWLIQGRGSIDLTAGSPQTGKIESNIQLAK